MPDWIAHLLFAFTVSTITRMKRLHRVYFLLGNLMPDFVRFLAAIGNFLTDEWFAKFIATPVNHSSHSILGVFVYATLISLFFKDSTDASWHGHGHGQENGHGRGASHTGEGKGGGLGSMGKMKGGDGFNLDFFKRDAFLFLFAGGLAHLFLDGFMWPWGGGIPWFYPIDVPPFTFSYGVVWPSTPTAMLFLLPFGLASIAMECILACPRLARRTIQSGYAGSAGHAGQGGQAREAGHSRGKITGGQEKTRAILPPSSGNRDLEDNDL